jgi:peptidoglycan hydrolase-like protein with peptidoglycan-binding domain
MVASARTKSAGFAASAPTSKPAASSEAVVPLAVVNLGLSTAQARNVQCWLKANWGYTGALDGQLGTNSWKAFQRNLRTYWGYTGAIDGIAGSGTQAAFKRFANACSGWC